MSTPVDNGVRFIAPCDRCPRLAWWRQRPSEPFPHCTCVCRADSDLHAITKTETS